MSVCSASVFSTTVYLTYYVLGMIEQIILADNDKMSTTVAVDDVMKSWRVVGNGGHQVDPRLHLCIYYGSPLAKAAANLPGVQLN